MEPFLRFGFLASKVVFEDIYIGLPNPMMLARFPGFQEIDRASLPDYLTTLVVREDKFGELFPDIVQKRRTRYA
jgi:hypothetical protein